MTDPPEPHPPARLLSPACRRARAIRTSRRSGACRAKGCGGSCARWTGAPLGIAPKRSMRNAQRKKAVTPKVGLGVWLSPRQSHAWNWSERINANERHGFRSSSSRPAPIARLGGKGRWIFFWTGRARNPLTNLDARKEIEGNGRGFRGFGSFRRRTWRALARVFEITGRDGDWSRLLSFGQRRPVRSASALRPPFAESRLFGTSPSVKLAASRAP